MTRHFRYASNKARFEQSYAEIAVNAKLPGVDGAQADTLQLVSRWLADESNGSLLLILDNSEDASVFFGL